MFLENARVAINGGTYSLAETDGKVKASLNFSQVKPTTFANLSTETTAVETQGYPYGRSQ